MNNSISAGPDGPSFATYTNASLVSTAPPLNVDWLSDIN